MANQNISRYFVRRSLLLRRPAIKAVRRDRWAIILAGGDGTRLRSLTRAIAGDDRPKQFCPILKNQTLLDQTRRRVEISIPAEQIIFSLTRTHESYYRPLARSAAKENLVIQPANLGTAPAILYSLLRLQAVDPSATVAFFPSDHYFAEDRVFMSHVDSAFRAVKANSELVVLLGMEAERPETEYGWIEPTDSLLAPLSRVIRRVERFWEKPSVAVAQNLMTRGCLWNSFVMVGRVESFLRLIAESVPELYRSFQVIIPALGTDQESAALEALYSSLRPVNFSHEVLAMQPSALSVMSVKDVGWSDWGDPTRVFATLTRLGIATEWEQAAV